MCQSGDTRQVELHRIPNLCLSKSGRQKTCIMFPGKYVSERGPQPGFTQPELRAWYEDCIRPAIAEVIPENVSHWPLNYNLGWTRMKGTRGPKQVHYSSLEIPAWTLERFAEVLRDKLEHHSNEVFHGAFFYHEWRGIKGATLHKPDDADGCDRALEEALKDIDVEEMLLEEGDNEWYLDVALEIQSPDLILQWKTANHADLLQYLLPSAPVNRAVNLPNTTAFQEDISSLCYQLAGFRIAVPAIGRADHVKYINVYTTDKCATYQLHHGAFTRHTPQCLFPSNLPQALTDLGHLAKLLYYCAGYRDDDEFDVDDNEESVKHEGAARAEVRVQLEPGHISDVLRHMDWDLINKVLVGFNAEDWW